MKKKILLGVGALVAVAAGVVGMSAFEAHIINVTAKIENALQVQTAAIEYGTVFPEELLLERFEMTLSRSFLEEPRADDVGYHIKQKDKPRDPNQDVCFDAVGTPSPCPPGVQGTPSTEYCHENRPQDAGNPADPYYRFCYPNLCPYLSKLPDKNPEPGNDGSIGAFHRPECDDAVNNDPPPGPGTDLLIDWPLDPQCTSKYDDSESEPKQQGLVNGILAKSLQDLVDVWTIDLHVPCFEGECAQDNVIPVAYQLDPRLEHQVFGCDLWIEVEEISRFRGPGPTQCSDWRDNDGDKLIDYPSDPQCSSLADDDESA